MHKQFDSVNIDEREMGFGSFCSGDDSGQNYVSLVEISNIPYSP